MREIKFRVYSPVDDKMYVPFSLTYDFPCKGGDFSKDSIFIQFTGLYIGDNEDEVWEGDILEFILDDGKIEIGVVRFSEYGYWTSQKDDQSEELLSGELSFYDGNVKIIGNIYQNPDLL